MKLKSKPAFYILPALIFLQSCAALTLDVDVYKGPLANDQDVLTQQTTVMATGAKPLLIKPRDTLELSCLQDPNSYQANKVTSEEYKDLSYSSGGYINGYQFCKHEAGTSNQILSLYYDRIAKQYTEIIKSGQNAIKKFEINQQILLPYPGNTQQISNLNKIWETYKKNLRSEIRDEWDCNESNSCSNQLIKNRVELAKAYKGFIKGDVHLKDYNIYARDVESIFKAQKKFEDSSLSPEELAKINFPLELNTNNLLDTNESVVSQFKALAENPELIRWHADQIFADKFYTVKNKFDFIRRVQQASQSFSNTMDAIQELLIVSLRATARLSTATDIDPNRIYLNYAVKISTNLIRSKHLLIALKEFNSESPAIEALLGAIKKNFKKSSIINSTEHHKNFPTPNSPNSLALRDTLYDLLMDKSPKKTYKYAHALLELNQRYIDSASKTNHRPLMGIALGPAEGKGPIVVATKFAHKLTKISAGGLENGRLPEGLDTLIEEYLAETR
ncbi:MAG: hypothetical protein HOF21_09995 [Nitrospina sp.]|nr:hypothetical protein [Nitrospina sp.]